jgi:putative IMPACT (imprinted ancient) family translation regulator
MGEDDRVVRRAVETRRTVERSRFHAFLFPAADQAQLEATLKARRVELRKARHHCWAARLPRECGAPLELSKDDGEVGHPGKVLLELLRKHELAGAIVVSRIFGGVKLGVGGVSRAFRAAGEAAITAYLEGS